MKPFTSLSILALATALICGCRSTPFLSTGMLKTDFNIDQPIQQLEETLEPLEQQQPRNYTISNISFLYEIKLHLIFEKYLETIPETERPVAIKEQKNWQKIHDKLVSEAYAEYEGGSYACFNAGEAAVKDFKSRIDEILKR